MSVLASPHKNEDTGREGFNLRVSMQAHEKKMILLERLSRVASVKQYFVTSCEKISTGESVKSYFVNLGDYSYSAVEQCLERNIQAGTHDDCGDKDRESIHQHVIELNKLFLSGNCLNEEVFTPIFCSLLPKTDTLIKYVNTAMSDASPEDRSDIKKLDRQYTNCINSIVIENVKLVQSAIYAVGGRPNNRYDDLVQDGCTEFADLMRNYKPWLNYQLSTYIVRSLRFIISAKVAKQSSPVTVPPDVANKVSRIIRAKELLEDKGEIATVHLLAKETGLSEQDIQNVSCIYKDPYTDEILDNPESPNPEYSQGCDDATHDIDRELLKQKVHQLIKGLPQSRRDIIKKRIPGSEEYMSLRELSELYECSTEKIRGLQTEALKMIKKRDTSGLLEEFYNNYVNLPQNA